MDSVVVAHHVVVAGKIRLAAIKVTCVDKIMNPNFYIKKPRIVIHVTRGRLT